MKMSFPPKREMGFIVYSKVVQEIKYLCKDTNHIPDTSHAIPPVVLQHPTKITLKTPNQHLPTKNLSTLTNKMT